MPPVSGCPSYNELQLLLGNALPPDRQMAVLTHLNGCLACTHWVEEWMVAEPWNLNT